MLNELLSGFNVLIVSDHRDLALFESGLVFLPGGTGVQASGRGADRGAAKADAGSAISTAGFARDTAPACRRASPTSATERNHLLGEQR